jgi:nucleoside-diphosphate-sugar epimerase
MRYALTGATGFVGGVLTRRLREAGHQVVALVRDPSRARDMSARGAEPVVGELDADGLDRLCTGADGLFHVAGWYRLGSRDPAEGWRSNVEGTRQALDAAERAGLKRIVYTSTLAVNSDTGGRIVDETYRFTAEHLSVYDETKARAQHLALEYAGRGIPIVIVMPGAVYGPHDTSQSGALLSAVIDGRRPAVPAGGGVCWANVEDVANGHLLAMERGALGQTYMLAGERASIADCLRLAAQIAGTKGPIVLPSAAVRVTAGLAARIERFVTLPADYAAESMRAALATYFGTAAKAERELGWSHRSLRDGLTELVTHLRS